MKKALLLFCCLLYSAAIVAQISITPLYGVRYASKKSKILDSRTKRVVSAGRGGHDYTTFSLDIETPLNKEWSVVVPITYHNQTYRLSNILYEELVLQSLNRKVYDTGLIARWRPSKYTFLGGGVALEIENNSTVIGKSCVDCLDYYVDSRTLTTKLYTGIELQAGIEFRRFIVQGRYRQFLPTNGRNPMTFNGSLWAFDPTSVLCLELGYRIVWPLGAGPKKVKRNKAPRKGKAQQCPRF